MKITLLLVSVLALPSSSLRLGHKSKELAQKTNEACAERKLIVNSHVNSPEPLAFLLASLKKHGFTKFQDVVVFQGGAGRNSEPYDGKEGTTLVDLKIDSFDLNAFYGLSKYKDNARVCADTYFYIHDTASVGPCFPHVFDELKAAPEEIVTPGHSFFSNQCVFGKSVVENFGTAFDVPVSKKDGLKVESGGCYGNACSPIHFAKNFTTIDGRISLGKVVPDIYSKGTRSAVWYKDWDLYKYISWEWKLHAEPPEHLEGEFLKAEDRQKSWASSCKRLVSIPVVEKNRLTAEDVEEQKRLFPSTVALWDADN